MLSDTLGSPSQPLSLRELARKLQLSHTTVSQALRDKPSVKLETRRRIQSLAKAAGYQCNPLVGALMAGMRRKRGPAVSGAIAIVDFGVPPGSSAAMAAYHRKVIDGALDRAEDLGFRVDIFTRGGSKVAQQSIDTLCQEHGVGGVFVLPPFNDAHRAEIAALNWASYSGLCADDGDQPLSLHSIKPDFYGAVRSALGRVQALGYRRPGFVLQGEGLRYWSDACYAYHASGDRLANVPMLTMLSRDDHLFGEWFKRYAPDVVISHQAAVLESMRALGATVPGSHGFCCLDISQNLGVVCSGLDHQPQLLGARAIEQLIGQIYRNERDIPQYPLTITSPAIWVDGHTLRGMSHPLAAHAAAS